MRYSVAALLLAVSGGSLAHAQARPNTMDGSSPRLTVSVGYARLRSNAPPSACNCFGANGGYASAAYSLRNWLRVAGEMTGTHADRIGSLGQNLTLTTYAAGPQLVLSGRRIEVFGQALFGVAHGSDSYFPTSTTATTSASSFAFSTGGGIDLGLTRHIAVRAAQVEYLHTSLPNASNNVQSHLMLGAGLVFRFGGASWDRDQAERDKAYRQMHDWKKEPKAAPTVASAASDAQPARPEATSTTLPATPFNREDFSHNVKSALFDYDSYELRPDAKAALEVDAAYLKAHPDLEVTVAGYADERGTAEYNLALGEKRAQAARDQLVANGVSPNQLDVVSYGKEVQLCTTDSENCYQENRRAGLEARR